MKETRVLLVGVGGYGEIYARELMEKGMAAKIIVAGAVDPHGEKSAQYGALRAMNVPFFDTLEAFYAENAADLAIISTPIALHASQAIQCMERGSHVLVEKPIAATVGEAREMIAARNRTGKKLAVGFQWCCDPAMRAFREDARNGVYGSLRRMKTLVLWPRDLDYYRRGSGWAGKKYDANGAPIFDCVASNATAHYLENMLWVAGQPLVDIRVETWRANPIETYDTIVLKGRIGTGQLTFVASHAAGRDFTQDPMFEYVFEQGTAFYGGFGQRGDELVLRLENGTEKNYGSSDPGGMALHKLWSTVEAIRTDGDVLCTAEDALLHAQVMEDCFRLRPDAQSFPEEQIRLKDNMYWVPGLYDRLRAAYEAD